MLAIAIMAANAVQDQRQPDQVHHFVIGPRIYPTPRPAHGRCEAPRHLDGIPLAVPSRHHAPTHGGMGL